MRIIPIPIITMSTCIPTQVCHSTFAPRCIVIIGVFISAHMVGVVVCCCYACVGIIGNSIETPLCVQGMVGWGVGRGGELMFGGMDGCDEERMYNNICTEVWAYIYMGVHIHGHTYTWPYIYMGVHIHGCTYTWAYIYMGVRVCSIKHMVVVTLYPCVYTHTHT